MKTSRSAQKRFKVTGTGKLLRRSVHQNHFNAGDKGDQRRKKRNKIVTNSTMAKKMKSMFVAFLTS